jgi:hypothetical protein
MSRMLHAFFSVIPRRLNFICRRFGTLFQLHRRVGMKNDSSYLPACEDGTECFETSAYKLQTPGITHKKAHNIQNTATVWNPEHVTNSVHIRSVSHLPVQLSVHEVNCLLLEQQPHWVRAYWLSRFLDHTQRRITVGRTPLGEWSARRRDLYMTTHNIDNRQTSMPPGGIRTRSPIKPQTDCCQSQL